MKQFSCHWLRPRAQTLDLVQSAEDEGEKDSFLGLCVFALASLGSSALAHAPKLQRVYRGDRREIFLPECEIVSSEGISEALDEREGEHERSSIVGDERPCSVPSRPRFR
ncbi:hypothetical protein NL676_022895 [Syzygium grande]|nr:hypothetical protein NL676_022895 [Syzygium grande]